MHVVEVLESHQFVFQVRRGPEQHLIHTLSSQGANQPFDKRVRQRDVRHTLDLGHPQDPQVGTPLVEPVQRVVVSAEAFRTQRSSNRAHGRARLRDLRIRLPRGKLRHPEHPRWRADGRGGCRTGRHARVAVGCSRDSGASRRVRRTVGRAYARRLRQRRSQQGDRRSRSGISPRLLSPLLPCSITHSTGPSP